VLDYARSFGVPATVLRMSCIYGQRQMGTEDQGWVAHFLIRALKGEQITLYGDGLQVRDILDVSNAVEAYLAAWRHIDRAAGQPSTSAAARQMRSACAHCLPKSAA
jgi:CDP-paratose 2-epimerase